MQGNIIAICLEQLIDQFHLLRQWLALCLAKVNLSSLTSSSAELISVFGGKLAHVIGIIRWTTSAQKSIGLTSCTQGPCVKHSTAISANAFALQIITPEWFNMLSFPAVSARC